MNDNDLSLLLLRRLRTVYLDCPARTGGRAPDPKTLVAAEIWLLERGYTLTRPLREALGGLGRITQRVAVKDLLARLDALSGAHRVHRPLFRYFPVSVPDDSHELYARRVRALLRQRPEQPCVLCAATGTVRPVAPCAHLVCRACWDGADYTGCPLCNRRIDPDDPFLVPVDEADEEPFPVLPGPLAPLLLGTDLAADTGRALNRLLARRTPLNPRDRADLTVLLEHAPPPADWLPDEIPVRESKALVLGTLLRSPATREAVRPLLAGRLTTATDVLRLLRVWSGCGPDLIGPGPLRSLPRGLRRELLAALEALPVRALVEDMSRRPGWWKAVGEVLHPFERHERHPGAALAFAVVRGTRLRPDALGAALRATADAHPDAVRRVGRRLRPVRHGAAVEAALASGDGAAAFGLLLGRPGQLLRRLDHVLRVSGPDGPDPAVAAALGRALPGAGPGPLLAAYGELRTRQRPGDRRVFLPRRRAAHTYAVPDVRAPLPGPLVREVCGALEAEVLRRLAGAPPVDLAVIDAELVDLPVPSAEHTASAALVDLPRGSVRPLPEGDVVRLFLHWRQPGTDSVDLDLSVALYDAGWGFAGLCDYTELTFGGRAAVHSGDLTSAPAPHGATEYVDLDPAALARSGARYLVPVVLSFDNTPFGELAEGFAGFMALPREGRDGRFHPGAVRQRFELTGPGRIQLPMLVDLVRRVSVWTDVQLPVSEGYHHVSRHRFRLGRLSRDLYRHLGAGRVTLWDLAVWHGAARADEVAVAHRAPGGDGTGELRRYRRADGEDRAAFAARVREAGAPDGVRHGDVDALVAAHAAGRRVLLALVAGDPAPEDVTGEVYRLLPGPVDGCGLDPLTARDLVAALAPADRRTDRSAAPGTGPSSTARPGG
ncbi:MXAN_6230/SCO0854 family RING domain-containing protein [Streptomyces sp. JNUCC 64]